MARTAVAKKGYVDNAGEFHRSASADMSHGEIRFLGDDGESVVDTIEIRPEEFPEDVRRCAMFHGFMQKLGDAYAGSKNKDESPYDLAMAVYEALIGGTWIKEGESAGPRATYLLDAICNVIAEVTGTEPDEAKRKSVAESIASKDAKQDALKDARIKAAYEKIKADAAVARAKAAAKAAKDGGGEDFLSGLLA